MAIIFTYPTKATPALTDTVVITDSESEDPEDRTKQISIASIKTTMGVVDGTGTANTMPKWSDSNTLTDSPFTIDTSTSSLEMPTYIRHIGDTDSRFGFQGDNHFRVQTGGQTTIQSISRTDENNFTGQVAGLYFNSSQRLFTRGEGVEVEGSLFMPGYIKHVFDNDSYFGFSAGNNFILHTDSGRKIAAGPDTVTLYSDTSETTTTTSVARLATATTGVLVYGQTIAAGAASERGGIIRYYNNANDRYVGISGPVTQGTSYQVRLPDSVGAAGQVLKLNTPLLGGSTQDLVWGNASGGGTPGGIAGSVQFQNSSSGFAGDAGFTFTNAGGLPKLTIGDTSQDTAGVIEIQSDENGGILKIGGGSQAYYTSIKGSDSDTANYNIILPPAGPGGNNKILESTNAGILSWIDTPSGTSYSAGNGLDLTGTTFSTDLKANGGLVIQSTELALDLGASAITGILSGNSLSLISTTNPGTNHSVLMGNGDDFVETGDSETAIQLPVGATNRRPAASATNVGLMRYNSQTANFEVCKQTTSSSGQYSWYTINVTIITE